MLIDSNIHHILPTSGNAELADFHGVANMTCNCNGQVASLQHRVRELLRKNP